MNPRIRIASFWVFSRLLLGAAAADLEWAGDAKDTAVDGFLAPSQDLTIVADSRPRGAATTAAVVFTADGATWRTQPMAHHGWARHDSADRWKANLGPFPEGTILRYAIEVAGSPHPLRLDDGGQPRAVTVRNAAAAIRWMGNLRTRPESDALEPGADLWVHSQMAPRGVAASADVEVSSDEGASWTSVPMAPGAAADGSEEWSANLGGFPEGATVRFAIRARNALGQSFRDDNTGSDYRLRVRSPIRDAFFDKARYAPGETATLRVDLDNPGPDANGALNVRVMRLAQVVASFHQPVSLPRGCPQTLSFPWKTPRDDFRGYGVDVDLLVDGAVRDARSTALDVSSDWTRFPRLGFFSEYPAGDDAEGKAADLAKFHINAVQFYDWKWTHDRLVPRGPDGAPADLFTQVGGRIQSFQAVKDKISALHARGMAAMAYSLLYGDSGNDVPEHVERAAFKVPFSTRLEDIRTHDAGAYSIWIMDVSNPAWKEHLFGQFLDAMDQAGFDGIHLDNLGGASCYRYGSDAAIPEREEFPRFIREARTRLRAAHPGARLTHNDVMGNYLPEIARSDADLYYSEVWTRNTYQDIRDNLLEAQAAGGGKPVVLAAYINRKPWDEIGDPAQPGLPTFINDASARLMDACVFAHGAFHIELGEDAQMLVNEYFPARSPRMHAGLRRSMRDLYDFLVRYQNLLSFDPRFPLRDVTDALRISSDTHALSPRGEGGAIWTVAKARADGVLALHLLNLAGVDSLWRNPTGNPTPQSGIGLKVHVDRRIRQVLIATPDDGLGRAHPVPFQQGTDADGAHVAFVAPKLAFWTLAMIVPETTPPAPPVP